MNSQNHEEGLDQAPRPAEVMDAVTGVEPQHSMNARTTPWTMDFNGPRMLLPFEYGTVQVLWTQTGHAHVTAEDGTPAVVMFRNRRWYLSVHVYAEDGWSEKVNGDPGYKHQFTSLDSDRKVIPPTWRAKIVAAISTAVAGFVAEHPEVLTAAARNNLQHQVASAAAETRKLTEQLATARETEQDLREQLTALDEQS